MPKPEAGKSTLAQDYVVTQHGSGPFRAFNFELYAVRAGKTPNRPSVSSSVAAWCVCCLQRPTGFMRLAAYAGTTAFVGILGYMMYEKNRLEASANEQRRLP